ncbi:MAG: GDP-mannose 4,6-dehydratase [Thermoplasmata archaeon]
MTKVLVTGGCGFIGTNLISYLLDHSNWFINVIDDFSEGKLKYLESIPNFHGRRVQVVEGDVREEEGVEEAINGCDHVVHLAAQTDVVSSINAPFHNADVNIMGTINVLEASLRHNVKKVCFASSAAAVGDHEPPVDESKLPMPISPYGTSKLAGEGYCSAYAGSHGISTAVLRFSNVYGPNSWHKGSVIAKFIKTIMDGKTPIIYGSGKQTRDFVHAKDIAMAIHSTLKSDLPSSFEVFQLGTGVETSVNELYSVLEGKLEDVPEPTYAPQRAGEIYRNYCDIAKAQNILGYEPRYDLEKGLDSTIEWFMKD